MHKSGTALSKMTELSQMMKSSKVQVEDIDDLPDVCAATVSLLFHCWVCCHRVMGEA